MATLLDFSAELIDPAAIKAAGHVGVIGYFSGRRPGAEWMKAKPLTREYCDRLRAEGLELVTNYQYGKGATSDWCGGYDAGVEHARIALANHFAAGGPGFRPLYAPVDDNPTLEEWNTLIAPFLRGWASVVGLEWTGVYCNARCIDWALEDGVATWFWQHNWSGDPSINGDHPAAHMHQIRIDKDQVAGVGVDINTILKDDYGQWSKAVAPQTPKPDGGSSAMKPDYTELDRMGNSCSSRNGARIARFLFHTQEGNGTAETLANYLNNPANGASYHYVVRDRIVCDVVDTDLSSWSVLDDNPRSINLCFAGSRASWSRDQWLAIEDDIAIACWLAVQDARKYGFAPDVIGDDYSTVRDGISDHRYVTYALGIGTHTDCGDNFPWDVVRHYVGQYLGATPAAPPAAKGNAINDCAAANPWLGDRLTVGENACPDGVGRFAEFRSGHVYWHPRVGAFAVPASIFEKWSALGWEAGLLGYPAGKHTDLTAGVVQGFEKGAIYRKAGQPGAETHGEIRNRWNRSGFEGGPFGWPVSDEEPFDGGARQRFEHGYIYWPGKRSTVALLDSGAPDVPVPDAQG
ncbi:glycoside hydrolase domain-containing protein [Nocardia brasiliensis]|uniref:glycoside hydrolase domain-containing protein n=1 Tax=Nocardia brasiliensis TaxID=37326 RepID=UPI002456DE97|nr:glycoside hydrolase domain-containing protein [Nocardia brasiliensis]